MLKLQRASGLVLVVLGGAAEAVALDAGRLDCVILSHCAAAFGAVLYSLTMTGRRTDALTALLPIPVLAPVAAVLLAWKRGDLSRPAPAPRRVVRFAEGVGLALALTAVGAGASALRPSLLAALAPTALPAAEPPARPVLPAPALEPPPEPVAAPEAVGAVLYQVRFVPARSELGSEARSLLSRVADTMHYYPLDDVLLTSAAPEGSADDTALAAARLAEVRRTLMDMGLRPSRIRSQVKMGAPATGTVDVAILPN